MRAAKLSTRLLLVASIALLPLAIVCGVALRELLKEQREQTRTATLGVARALATAVDSELRLTVAALQALALTDPLGDTEESGLMDALLLAKALRASHPEWRGVLLSTPTGQILFSTEGPTAPLREQLIEPGSLFEAVRTGAPTIGPLMSGPSGNLAFAVRVPIVRDGVVRSVLNAIVRPEAMAAVLQRQRVPDGWTVSIFDSNARRVARSVGDGQFVGRPPSESLRNMLAVMGDRKDYIGQTDNIDGTPLQSAVARLDFAPWFVALGAPRAFADNAMYRTLSAYGGGLLVSLLVGVLAAWWISRSVTQPMRRLALSAEAMGRGQAQPIDASGIVEVDAVGNALAGAVAQRLRNEAERDSLLTAERNARAAAQAAQLRLERLLSVSAALSRSLEEESTLKAIGDVIVPGVADLCRIDLLDENDVLQRKLTHHVDPARGKAIAEFVGSHASSVDAPGSFPWAIATGKTFFQNLDDEHMPDALAPTVREFVDMLGVTAGCVVPLIARGRTIGAMAILQDQSQRRFSPEDAVLIAEVAQRAALARDNVRLLARARHAQAQAEVANQTKDEFLAMLGHELRNPLAPISLALTLIARRDPGAFPRERQIIERQVKHLSMLVNDLLDISRIVSGKIALDPQQVDMRDIVAKAIELTLPAYQARAALPQVTLPAKAVPVHGDPLRLAQIVGNLLNNAAKFSEPDSRVEAVLRIDRSDAVLEVRDAGIGISADLLPRVFERFVQGAQPLHRAKGGLGLGMAIARSLTTLHGGSIDAFSEGTDQGSIFTVRLPLVQAAAPAQPVAVADLQATRLLKVLIVDDNRDALDALAECLVLEGHEVVTAGTAEDALALLETQDAKDPEAGIFDIGLPGMSGYALAERMRGAPRHRHMVLFALTGYGQAADRDQALAAGFDAHFSKPVDLQQMQAELQAAFVRRKAATSA
ncbi:hypothetical protein BH10PSE18_BH10PSE18_32760 [soil metagenome]